MIQKNQELYVQEGDEKGKFSLNWVCHERIGEVRVSEKIQRDWDEEIAKTAIIIEKEFDEEP